MVGFASTNKMTTVKLTVEPHKAGSLVTVGGGQPYNNVAAVYPDTR